MSLVMRWEMCVNMGRPEKMFCNSSLKWIGIYVFMVLMVSSCAVLKPTSQTHISLRYLDEYVVPDDMVVDGTLVGGLSDLDYDGKYFYTVCDLPSSPRIYQFSLEIKDYRIDTLEFLKMIPIRKDDSSEFSDLFFDSEGLIFHSESNGFTLSSEGSVKNGRDPFLADLDSNGGTTDLYELPSNFLTSEKEGPRNNGVFEGLCHTLDRNGVWVVNELPLRQDGSVPRIFRSKSPVRFTRFDRSEKIAEKQFYYPLDRLRKIPLLPYGINGVTAVLEYEKDRFLVLERGFSAGYGNHGFRVLLYRADAREADDVLGTADLRGKLDKLQGAKKELVFDFNSIRKKLSRRSVDNLEGMAFGPLLPNGNRTLILIADNNFNRMMPQMNQVILMEVVEEQ